VITTRPPTIDVDRAAEILKCADRIVVIGCSGTGKSSLSVALAAVLKLDYVSLDQIFWLPGWTIRPRVDINRLIEDAVERPRWIIDGNSPSTLPLRLRRADLVIWRRPARLAAVIGVFKRWLRFRGKTRPEMAAGCRERLDLAILRYIWTFDRVEAPQFEEVLAAHGAEVPILTLRSHHEARKLLRLVA
jgi:adenylate kinase family enzyme